MAAEPCYLFHGPDVGDDDWATERLCVECFTQYGVADGDCADIWSAEAESEPGCCYSQGGEQR